MKSNTSEKYLPAAIAACVKQPFEFALDLVAAPNSSRSHYARAVANLAHAAARAENDLANRYPGSGELVRASIASALAAAYLDADDFTTSTETGEPGLSSETVKANLARLERLLSVHARVVIDAAALLNSKQGREGRAA